MNQQSREQLPSKKNFVFLERQGQKVVVAKIFTDQSRFQMEKKIGDILMDSSLLIPERLDVDEKQLMIIYSFIQGASLVDLIENVEPSEATAIFSKLCAWLVKFYSIIREKMGCQYILGDIHLRNFIYSTADNNIYGFDFEECRPGRIETDAARLWVFILHYDPAFTQQKKTLAAGIKEKLFAALTLDEGFFQEEVQRETADLKLRRSTRKISDPLAL